MWPSTQWRVRATKTHFPYPAFIAPSGPADALQDSRGLGVAPLFLWSCSGQSVPLHPTGKESLTLSQKSRKKTNLSFLLTLPVVFVNLARLIVEKHNNFRDNDDYAEGHMGEYLHENGVQFAVVVKAVNPDDPDTDYIVMRGNRETLGFAEWAKNHPAEYQAYIDEHGGVPVQVYNPKTPEEEHDIRADHSAQKGLGVGGLLRQMVSYLASGRTFKQALKEFAIQVKETLRMDVLKNGTIQSLQMILCPKAAYTQFILHQEKKYKDMIANFTLAEFRKIAAAQANADSWDEDTGWGAEALKLWNEVIDHKDGLRSADKEVRGKAEAEAAAAKGEDEKPVFDARVQAGQMKSEIMKKILGCVQRCDLGTLHKIDEEFKVAEDKKAEAAKKPAKAGKK